MTIERMRRIADDWLPRPRILYSSLAEHTICRQTPKVGAECVNCACSDLCGGRSVMGVSTAIPPARTKAQKPSDEASRPDR